MLNTFIPATCWEFGDKALAYCIVRLSALLLLKRLFYYSKIRTPHTVLSLTHTHTHITSAVLIIQE